MTHFIAMWSGPRNISTAMMRSWENRPDTSVHDEPFYAHYLQETGIDHPGRDEVIASQPVDWRAVVKNLTRPVPHAISYQKHMTHHMLDHIKLDWLLGMTNCFLIREPSEVIVSLTKVLPHPVIEQTGIPRQTDLFRYVREQTGEIPPVIDARDVLMDPKRMLSKLCERIDVPFLDTMLSWPAGKRETDGVWARHWYAGVEASTGFKLYQPSDGTVREDLQDILAQCEAMYQQLAAHKL